MTKMTFIADTHHYSRKLGDTGKAYELRSGSDFKCLAETGSIIDSAFKKIIESDTQAVIIAGDLTNNGEVLSHNEIIEKLKLMNNTKPVYVITATHDWCSDNKPNRYENDNVISDVNVYAPQDLRNVYSEFGPNKSLSEYITKLNLPSYTVDIGEDVRLLMINDDNDDTGKAGYSEEHFLWIEEQIKKARDESKTIIGVEHHLIMPHIHKVITIGGQSLSDWEKYSSRLADAGLRYMFVGHSHIQRVSEFTSVNGNTIKQINIGSLVGFPAPIINVTVENNKVIMDTVSLDTFIFNGKEYNARDYLAEHSFGLISNVLDASANKKDFAERLTALGIKDERILKSRIIRKSARYLSKSKVKNIYRIINILTLRKGINKIYAKEYWNTKVTDIIKVVYLNAFGGSYKTYTSDSAFYMLVKEVLSVPLLFKKDLKIIHDIVECAENIITGGKYNSLNGEL